MARGFLSEYENFRPTEEPQDQTVDVVVRVEHKTARALQVSQDRGQSTVWVPLSAVSRTVPAVFGPGDSVTLTIPEKMAEQKELL